MSVYWLGPTTGSSGYAEEGRALTSALHSFGVRTTAIDIAQPESPDDVNRLARELGDRDFGYRDGDWVIHHRAWACRPTGGGRHIWRTMFETDSIPFEWVDTSNCYEQIWVPSAFNAQTFTAAGVPSEKLRVVNCPVPSEWPGPNTRRELERAGGGTFRFFSVMRWQQRKGWDSLLTAFAQEFSHDPSVELTIHATPFYSGDFNQINREYAALLADLGEKHLPNVTILSGHVPNSVLVERYMLSDAFVLSSRGEGWGRPYMEAMLMGLPTIGSRWSGNLAFMNEGNSFLIDGEVRPVSSEAVREWPYFHGHNWFEPSVSDLRRIMRSMVDGQSHLADSPADISADLRRRFSLGVIAEQMVRNLI